MRQHGGSPKEKRKNHSRMKPAEPESDDIYILIVEEAGVESALKVCDVNDEEMPPGEDECVLSDVQKILLGDYQVKVKYEPLPVKTEPPEVKLEPEDIAVEPPHGTQNKLTEIVQAMAAHAQASPPPLPHTPYKKKKGQYKCLYCNEVSKTEKVALKHYRFKHGERYNKCYACSAAFRRHDSLLFHESYCKADNAHLVRWARVIHSGRKPVMSRQERRAMKLPCKICGKLICRGNMSAHIQLHSDKKKYACSYCPAKYRTKRSQKAHINTHMGIRPYQCNECPKAYTSDTALRAHISDHSKKFYQCSYCDRSFKRKETLKHHLAVHTDGNEYLCNQCGKVLNNELAMKKHTNAHNKKSSRVSCQDCGRTYNKMTSLNYHMKTKHGRQIFTRKMFFNKLTTMADVSSLLADVNSHAEELVDDLEEVHSVDDDDVSDDDADPLGEDE